MTYDIELVVIDVPKDMPIGMAQRMLAQAALDHGKAQMTFNAHTYTADRSEMLQTIQAKTGPL